LYTLKIFENEKVKYFRIIIESAVCDYNGHGDVSYRANLYGWQGRSLANKGLPVATLIHPPAIGTVAGGFLVAR